MRRVVQASLLGASLLTLAIAGTMVAGPVRAASPKIEANEEKFNAFCKLIRDIDDLPDQEDAKAEALDVELEKLLRSIGFDVLQAWDLGGDLDPQSEDGMAFEAAMEAIEEKCPD